MTGYGEWCPKCNGAIVSVTRGIPSMGLCAKGHRTDRREVLRVDPATSGPHEAVIDTSRVDSVAAAIWPVIESDYTWSEALDRAEGRIPDDEFSQATHKRATAYARDLARAAIAEMSK